VTKSAVSAFVFRLGT